MDEFPGTKILRWRRLGPLVLGAAELGLDLPGDPQGDLILDSEYIVQLAVKVLRPDMVATEAVEELSRNSDAPFGVAHAAFHHIAHTERRGDLTQIRRRLLVSLYRVARDHEELTDAAQRRRDVLGDSVGEEILVGIVRHVNERQDRNRGPVWRREADSRRLPRQVRWRNAVQLPPYLADEPHTLARDRPDQALLIAVVADCAACCIDAADERRFGHDPSVRDGIEEVILANDATAVLNQIDQQIEDLRLHRHGSQSTAELPTLRVQDALIEVKAHAAAL